jgi:TolB-like protein
MKKAIDLLLFACFNIVMLAGSSFIMYGQEQKKPAIAVLTIESKGGVSRSEAGTLSDRLSTMLVNTNAFIVLERGKMNEILSEQGFQQTGCTTTECAVKVGELLNVQKMVSGSIGKIGQTYTIDLSLIDVKTAQIDQSFARDYKGEIDGLLQEMEAIAGQIAAKTSGKPVEEQKYVVSIKSTPAGGTIIINSKEIGNTPYSFIAQKGMSLDIKIERKGYKPWQQIVTINEDTEINAVLEAAKRRK